MPRDNGAERPTDEQAEIMSRLSATVARRCGTFLEALERQGYDAHQHGCLALLATLDALENYAPEHQEAMRRASERHQNE